MLHVRWNDDRIAGVQYLRLIALEADAPDPGQTIERLSNRMRVPRSPRTRCERNDRGTHPRRRGTNNNLVLKHGAAERLGCALFGSAVCGANHWHVLSSF